MGKAISHPELTGITVVSVLKFMLLSGFNTQIAGERDEGPFVISVSGSYSF